MAILFLLVFFSALVMIPVALIKPSFATKGKIESRKKASLLYVGAMVLSFIGVGITAPTPPQTQVAGTKIEATAVPEASSEENNKIQEAQPFVDTATPEPLPTEVPTPSIKPTPKPAVTPKPTSKPTIKPTAVPTVKPTDPPQVNIAPPISGGDKDCADFSSHAEAQAYFNAKGGSPSNNVDDLDRDHDGEACESLK